MVRNSDSTYNFSDLMKPDTSKKKNPSQFKYSFNNIKIAGAQIKFTDMAKSAHHEIRQLNLIVPFFSNLDYYTDVYCTPAFSAVVNGTLFELNGKSKPFKETMETEIAFKINKFDLAKYLEYIPQELNFNLNTAFISTDGHFTFRMKENKNLFLNIAGFFY